MAVSAAPRKGRKAATHPGKGPDGSPAPHLREPPEKTLRQDGHAPRMTVWRLEDIDGESTQSSRKCSNADSSLVLPVDGAVDLREEELEQSVYGLCFALDPSAVPPSLRLFNSCLTVTYSDSTPSRPHPPIKVRKPAVTPDSMALLPHVCADVIIARGQYYWEVDVCNSSVCRVGYCNSNPGKQED